MYYTNIELYWNEGQCIRQGHIGNIPVTLTHRGTKKGNKYIVRDNRKYNINNNNNINIIVCQYCLILPAYYA